jgi:hypothetical protein
MSKIITGPLNFSTITSEQYPESGSYIIGIDIADGLFKKMDYLGVLTIVSPEIPELPTSPTFSSLNLSFFSMGSTISFNHTAGSGNTIVDIIDTDVQITRNNSGFLYNPLFESSASGTDPYPTNTEWAYSSEGDDFSTAKSRTYDTLRNTVLNEIGDFLSLPGEVLIMHDTTNDKYYKIAFTSWQSGSGGSFSYYRTPIIFTGDGLIHFPDGSTMSTAPTPPVIPTASDFGLPTKWYRVLISQSGTGNPSKTDVSNNAGNFNWSRDSQGYYKCDFSSLGFPYTKIVYRITPNSNHPDQSFHLNFRNDGVAEIYTGSAMTGNTQDSLLVDTVVEIEFYT